MSAVQDDAINLTTPDGDEFIVEIWKPSWSEGIDIWDSLAYALWSLVSPGWRINVKRFPVRGRKAIHRERAVSRADAQQRAEAIAESLSRNGYLPPKV
jgi:hypothetical protein